MSDKLESLVRDSLESIEVPPSLVADTRRHLAQRRSQSVRLSAATLTVAVITAAVLWPHPSDANATFDRVLGSWGNVKTIEVRIERTRNGVRVPDPLRIFHVGNDTVSIFHEGQPVEFIARTTDRELLLFSPYYQVFQRRAHTTTSDFPRVAPGDSLATSLRRQYVDINGTPVAKSVVKGLRVNGREAYEITFEAKGNNTDLRLLADAETDLPVEIRQTQVTSGEFPIQIEDRFVFRYDVEVPELLAKANAGYRKYDLSQPPELGLAKAQSPFGPVFEAARGPQRTLWILTEKPISEVKVGGTTWVLATDSWRREDLQVGAGVAVYTPLPNSENPWLTLNLGSLPESNRPPEFAFRYLTVKQVAIAPDAAALQRANRLKENSPSILRRELEASLRDDLSYPPTRERLELMLASIE